MATAASINVAVIASTASFEKGMEAVRNSAAKFEATQLRVREAAGLAQRALDDQTGTLGYIGGALQSLGPVVGGVAGAFFLFNKYSEEAEANGKRIAEVYAEVSATLESVHKKAEGAFSGPVLTQMAKLTEQSKKYREEAIKIIETMQVSKLPLVEHLAKAATTVENQKAALTPTLKAMQAIDGALAELERDTYEGSMAFGKGSTKQLEQELQMRKFIQNILDTSVKHLTVGTEEYVKALAQARDNALQIRNIQADTAAKQAKARDDILRDAVEGEADNYNFKMSDEEKSRQDMFFRLEEASLSKKEKVINDLKTKYEQLESLFASGEFDPKDLANIGQGLFDRFKEDLPKPDEKERFGTFKQIDPSLINIEGLSRQRQESKEVTSPQLEQANELLQRILQKLSQGVPAVMGP